MARLLRRVYSVLFWNFLKVAKSIGRLKARIHSDDATENSLIKEEQITVRSQHNDEYAGLESYCVGKSPANQRIESIWWQFT